MTGFGNARIARPKEATSFDGNMATRGSYTHALASYGLTVVSAAV